MYWGSTYTTRLRDYCEIFYIANPTPSDTFPYTNNKNCGKFRSDVLDLLSFNWMNDLSSESMKIYYQFIKNSSGTAADDIICNYNIITFITCLVILIVNMIFVNLSEAMVREIDFDDESPSDYTLLVSGIPREERNVKNLMNKYLKIPNLDIRDINLTYKLTEAFDLRIQRQSLTKLIDNNEGEKFKSGFLCFKKDYVKSE